MWSKIFVVFHFIVLPNSISCQPVTDNIIIRDTRQTTYEECCPCSRDDGPDFQEQDISPSSSIGLFAQESDDACPCALSGTDSQGSSSIFRPFILKSSYPTEREQQSKQVMKPLLQPEVGLASSVLETIQKATDEEYQEALARDAARNLVEIESGFLDSEPGNSRNSVTIVLNPRDDLYDGDDTMPEASHVHETRCIHSPLGRASLPSSDIPRKSKQNLLLKRKPVGYSYKSLYDMDNSASNIKENYDVNNNNNGLSPKLRMNSLLLNNLSTKNGEETVNDPISTVNSRYKLKTITPEYCNDLKNNELNNSPKFRLAAIRNRLRELVDMRNTKLLNNNVPTTLSQNNLDIFSKKGSDSDAKLATFEANSPLDALFDKKSPALKNILKLKDVELLPPSKTINEDLTEERYKLSDLKVAGSENNVMLTNINKGKAGKPEEYDISNLSNSEEYISKDQTASEEESMTSMPSKNSNEMQTITDKEIKLRVSKGSSNKVPQLLDECLKLATNNQDVVNKSDQIDIVNDSSEYDSKEADDEIEMEDSVAETSDNMKEQLSQEANVDFSNAQQSVQESSRDSLLHQENDGLTIFKNDILRKLENIKKTIKSKLQDTDTETITKPILSQLVNERTTTNQDLYNSDLNSEDTLNMAVTLSPRPTNEDDITIQDLQKQSDSLLEQENSLKANTIPFQDELNFDENIENQDYETSINATNDNRSVSSEYEPTDTEINEKQISSEDENDPIYNEPNSRDIQENNSESPRYTCDAISKENDELNTENILPKDSAINEMSFQASNSKYNAISPPLNNNNLRGPTLQDMFSLFKTPFEIPSLEEIRHGITDIIDAGQQESEDFQTEFDPLNQGSNRNSVLSNPLQSNLPKFNYLGNPLTDRYIRPFHKARNNIAEYKSILETVTLKPLITEPLSNPSIFRYPLSLGSDRVKTAGNQKLKSSLVDTAGIPSIDDIKGFLETQKDLKPPKMQLLRTDISERPIFPRPQKINSFTDDLKYRLDNSQKPDFKHANQGNQLLSKPKLETNEFLQSMSRKHEDMKEKLQALHIDFNDRLASIYKKLNDQKKIQSVNIPTFKEKGKSLALPKTISKNEGNDLNLISDRLGNSKDNFIFEPQMLQEAPMKKKIKPKTNYVPLQIPLRNNNNMNKNIETLKERQNIHNSKFPNLSEKRKYMNKQRSFTPINKVKISFTTTTIRPRLTAGLKLQNDPDLIKVPSRLLEKERKADINSNMKDISKDLRPRLQSLGDSSHAPSELIETKNLNEALANSQHDPSIDVNIPRINNKQADFKMDPNLKHTLGTTDKGTGVHKKKESQSVTNLRETLRARLENVTRTHATPKTKYPVEATNLKEADAIVSPSNVKNSVFNNPLIENTSYKCTMVCSKDS